MAGETRHTDSPVVAALLADPSRYGFFQAVRLLEFSRQDAVPLGGAGPSEGEAVRLRPDTSFAHPRSSVTRIERVQSPLESRERFQVTQALIGLYGLRSPMPSVFGEEILERSEDDDPVRAFLDLFHHRFLSLLYRAWGRSRVESIYRADGQDILTWLLSCLTGSPQDLLPASLPFDSLRLAKYSRLFVRRARPAEGLEAIVSDALDGADVRLEPYAGRWVGIPLAQTNRLGVSNSTLCQDLLLGGQVYDVATKFRLWIGPMDYAGYLALVPGGGRRHEIGAFVSLYAADALDYDVRLGIRREAKPEFLLSSTRGGVRLGIDAWLRAEEPQTSWEEFASFPGFRDSASGAAA